MPEVFYVPAPHDPWEWGWDAWVAIGTIALAVVTVATLFSTWLAERKRRSDHEELRRKEAGYMSIAFDHELHMAQGLSLKMIRAVRKYWFHSPTTALFHVIEGTKRLQVPFLTKFAARVNRFDVDTATMLTVALSRILQAKLNVPPQPPADGVGLPVKFARRACRNAVGQATKIIRETRAARQALEPYHPKNIKIVKPAGRYRPVVRVITRKD